MPLYAAGVGETLTPFSLAGVVPPLTFSWSISNRQIAQLKSAFHTVCLRQNVCKICAVLRLSLLIVVLDVQYS